ncbi:hypothetical protein [Pseudomonas putida]|uniref:hypothetical protein n=1 Tax=Pseudomonas putida TaxID=303 RepID=UPI002B253B13|nr:hypothetical protein [Pseudomonas putida]
MPCALKFTSGFVAGEVASRYVVEPVARRAIGGLVGNPVDIATGRKLIPDEIDFSLSQPDPPPLPVRPGR